MKCRRMCSDEIQHGFFNVCFTVQVVEPVVKIREVWIVPIELLETGFSIQRGVATEAISRLQNYVGTSLQTNGAKCPAGIFPEHAR